MLKVRDFFQREIHLSQRQWKHIIDEHPEVENYFDEISNVLQEPDYIKRSKSDPTVWLYYHYYSEIYSGKYLLVVVKHALQSFMITFYVTDRIKTGETLWQKE